MYHFYRSLLSEVRLTPKRVGQWPAQRVQIGMTLDPDMADSRAGLSLLRFADAADVGRHAAALVAAQLAEKPDSAIAFPTGNTPLPMYAELRLMFDVDWTQSQLFQLDEYIPPPGQPAPHPYETFATFMDRQLWNAVGGHQHYLADSFDNPIDYERLLTRNGGPDLIILGIGANGHIAFNEPGSPPDSCIRVVDLAEETMISNFGAIDKAIYPTQAITLGIRTILQARHILLLATGAKKQDILKQALNPAEPPSIDCPASWLKRHPHVTVMTDFEISWRS